MTKQATFVPAEEKSELERAAESSVKEKNQLIKCRQTTAEGSSLGLWENQQRTKVLHEAHEEEEASET